MFWREVSVEGMGRAKAGHIALGVKGKAGAKRQHAN